jgi:hypothetical protein
MTRPVHQSADLFPMMTDEELADLAADTKRTDFFTPLLLTKRAL